MSKKRPPQWYKDAIIYELNIKGFYDSNGDGIGDFAGLEQKLDYLQDLGITAIWLLPFYPSPLRDDGYDISDYYQIREAYGNIDDFKRFLDQAHRRDLHVITELVINHTSDQHPWFQKARRAPKGSPERDFYVWSDDPNQYKDVRIIFQDFETSNWTWDAEANAYFWHRFYSHQPDLNFDNPAVQEEIFKILDYWANMGIDGFRLDAIPYLFERENTNCENLPETHAFLKKLRNHMDTHHDNLLFLAEANMWPEDSASYFGDGDECHMNYHFPLMPRMYMSVKMEDRQPITNIFEQTPAIPENCQWATFLRNHDELTLEMVTDEERDFMYQVYAKDRTARINLGIRRRLAPLMDNDRNKIELLNVLLLSLPGTPVLYYGDEIGMGDNFYLGDRDGVRTPMQWDSGENAGFSHANPQQLYLPVIRDPEYSYRSVNVQRQQQNQNSLLWWTKRILSKRKQYQVFGRGDIHFLNPDNTKVLAFVRSYENEQMLIVVSLSRYPESVQLDLSNYAGSKVKEVFGQRYFPEIQREAYNLSLSPFGYYWLELESRESSTRNGRNLEQPSLEIATIQQITEGPVLAKLARQVILPFLKQVSWFGPRAADIDDIEVHSSRLIEDDGRSFLWLLFELSYREGLPELIQLPIAFYRDRKAKDFNIDEEVIGLIKIEGHEFLLRDAIYSETFRHYLAKGFTSIPFEGFNLETDQSSSFAQVEGREVLNEINKVEYFEVVLKEFSIKFYRRLSYDPSPDQELKQALGQLGFVHSPKLLGSLLFKTKDKRKVTLAFYEERLRLQGYAWDFLLDQFQRLSDELLGQYDQLRNEQIPEVGLLDEMHFNQMPSQLQQILGTMLPDRLARLGEYTAQMHRTLDASQESGFGSEMLSLHYQRSLFSGLKAKLRSSLALLKRKLTDIPEEDREIAQQLIDQEENILVLLRRIYDHKIEAKKIRIHGHYSLEQLGIQDDDFIILNFDGDPELPVSQRRLLRSVAKDIASLTRSIIYAYRQTLLNQRKGLRPEQYDYLAKWLRLAYRCLSAEFMTAYREGLNGTDLLPNDEQDLERLLDTFSIEKALQEIRYDLANRPNQVSIPITSILAKLGV